MSPHTLGGTPHDPRFRTAEEMVVSVLRESILLGALAPGHRLRQESLAEELGVSRVPIRAALRHLESEGLVVSVPHKGAMVRRLEPEEIAETYELRILLETHALRAAVERVTAEEVGELQALADEIDRLTPGDDWLDATEAFYMRLYEIAGRPLTADLIARLRTNVGRYWLSLKVLHHEGFTHRVIVDAIAAGDSTEAEAWLVDHLTLVSKELQRRVRDHRAVHEDA